MTETSSEDLTPLLDAYCTAKTAKDAAAVGEATGEGSMGGGRRRRSKKSRKARKARKSKKSKKSQKKN
jgi:hypothetical protein